MSPKTIDSDVMKEALLMETSAKTQLNDLDLVVQVSKLTKTYPYAEFKAVDNISFGVRRGECFGLLGVNGAGKTTIFKMLCGQLRINSGQAKLMNMYDINQYLQMKKAQKIIGYCPQFDALLDNLSV